MPPNQALLEEVFGEDLSTGEGAEGMEEAAGDSPHEDEEPMEVDNEDNDAAGSEDDVGTPQSRATSVDTNASRGRSQRDASIARSAVDKLARRTPKAADSRRHKKEDSPAALHAQKLKKVRRTADYIAIQRSQPPVTSVEAAVAKVSNLESFKIDDNDLFLLASELAKGNRCDIVNGLP